MRASRRRQSAPDQVTRHGVQVTAVAPNRPVPVVAPELQAEGDALLWTIQCRHGDALLRSSRATLPPPRLRLAPTGRPKSTRAAGSSPWQPPHPCHSPQLLLAAPTVRRSIGLRSSESEGKKASHGLSTTLRSGRDLNGRIAGTLAERHGRGGSDAASRRRKWGRGWAQQYRPRFRYS